MQVGRSLLTVVKASAKLMTKPGMLPGGLCPLYGSLRSRWKFLDIHTSEKAADP